MAETQVLFAHDTKTPQVVSWAEVGEPNQRGYQRINVVFGLGQGAIRSWQHKLFDDGEWSSPITDNMTIAGSTEVALRPDMPMDHLTRANLRTIWEPTKSSHVSMTDPEDIFSGRGLASSDPQNRKYFTEVGQTWDYLAAQMSERDLLPYLPAIYYNVTLSQVYQLSTENQQALGPLAGDFDTTDGPIHSATMYERMSVAREADRLRSEEEFIEQLQKLRDVNPGSRELAGNINGAIRAVLTRAQQGADKASTVLETANLRPFDTFKSDTKQISERIHYLSQAAVLLGTLEQAEASLAR